MQYLITCNPILYILIIIILCAKKKEEGIEERKITTKTNYGTVRIFVLNYYSGMAVIKFGRHPLFSSFIRYGINTRYAPVKK